MVLMQMYVLHVPHYAHHCCRVCCGLLVPVRQMLDDGHNNTRDNLHVYQHKHMHTHGNMSTAIHGS